jgi:hypothetical protein
MKLYENNAYCFVCAKSANIFDFAAWRLGLPCDKTHFPQIAREVESALGIPSEWRPSTEERRAYFRKNRDASGRQMAPLSKSAVFREGLLREMAGAIDGGNMERSHAMAELIFALYLLPEEKEPEEKRLTAEEKERLRMAEGLSRT